MSNSCAVCIQINVHLPMLFLYFQVSKAGKVEQLKHDLSQYMSGPTLDFVMCQVREGTKKPRGRRWSPHDKSLAMSLLHSGPKTYRLLQKIFKLPGVETLRREMAHIQVRFF